MTPKTLKNRYSNGNLGLTTFRVGGARMTYASDVATYLEAQPRDSGEPA